jgi:hypothetical protein
MHTGYWDERDLDFRVFPSLPFDHLHPEMSLKRLGQCNGEKVVSIVLIPAGQKTIITSGALI